MKLSFVIRLYGTLRDGAAHIKHKTHVLPRRSHGTNLPDYPLKTVSRHNVYMLRRVPEKAILYTKIQSPPFSVSQNYTLTLKPLNEYF